MRLGLPLCLVATLVGCAYGADRTQSASASEPPAVVSVVSNTKLPPSPKVSAAGNPDDPRPVLTVGFWTYGPAENWRPKDLAEVYVYPDGTVIRVALDGTENTVTRSLQFETFAIDSDQLLGLLSLADTAGLTGDGLQPMVPLPAGVQIEDGGATVFTTRHGDEETARAVDQLSADNSHAVGDRIPFGHLLAALSPLCCEPRDDMTVLPFTRWAIVSAPGVGYAPSSEQDWTGPNLADLAWVDIGDDVKCAIVDHADWPLTHNERRAPVLILDGRIITRRPLLPREHGCEDVAVVRQLLGL